MNHSFEHDGHVADIMKSEVVHQNRQFLESTRERERERTCYRPRVTSARASVEDPQTSTRRRSSQLNVTHSSLYRTCQYWEEWAMFSCEERLLVDVWRSSTLARACSTRSSVLVGGLRSEEDHELSRCLWTSAPDEKLSLLIDHLWLQNLSNMSVVFERVIHHFFKIKLD